MIFGNFCLTKFTPHKSVKKWQRKRQKRSWTLKFDQNLGAKKKSPFTSRHVICLFSKYFLSYFENLNTPIVTAHNTPIVTVRIPQVLVDPTPLSPIKIPSNLTPNNNPNNNSIEDKNKTKPHQIFNLKHYQNIFRQPITEEVNSKKNFTFTKNKQKKYLVKNPNKILVKNKSQRLIKRSSSVNIEIEAVEAPLLGRILAPADRKNYHKKSVINRKKVNRSFDQGSHQPLLRDVENTIGHNKVSSSISVDGKKRAE